MKLNIRRIFRHTNESTAQKIAELCPPVNESTRERIFRNAVERAEKPVMQEEEIFHVETVRPIRWRRIAAAAACIAVVGTAVIGIGRYANITIPEPPEQPAASDAVQSGTVETTTQTQEHPKVWTQQEVYDLCVNAGGFLREQERFSMVTCTNYPDSGHSLRSEVSADLSQEIWCVSTKSTRTLEDREIEIQENFDYCAAGYELSLVDYVSDTPDIGTCRIDAGFALPAISKTAGSAFYGEMMLSDFSKWEISGTDTYLLREDHGNGAVSTERTCIVLDISDDTTKLCADAVFYQLLVDAENGMWLSITGYDADGVKIYEYWENDLKYGNAAVSVHPYDVGEKIRQGDYSFETPFRLEDLPEVYWVHPSNFQAEETTTTASLYQTNIITIFTEEVTDSIPETEQTKQTMTVPVESETTISVTTQKQTETVKTSETTTTTTTASDLTAEQQLLLEELRAEGERQHGTFVRQEKIICGELPSDAPRMTVALMEEIIRTERWFDNIMQQSVAEISPDFVDFYSFAYPMTYIQYWLDETGSEQILIMVQEKTILYVHPDETATEDCYEKLY